MTGPVITPNHQGLCSYPAVELHPIPGRDVKTSSFTHRALELFGRVKRASALHQEVFISIRVAIRLTRNGRKNC